jgi:hypothetical protein
MPDSCVVDADAVRRFAAVARQAFRDADAVAGAMLETVEVLADLVPQSGAVPVWHESASAAAHLVRHSAGCFDRLAAHVEQAVAAYLTTDLAGAVALDRLVVRV